MRSPLIKKFTPETKTVFLGKGLPPPGLGGRNREYVGDMKSEESLDSWYKENMEGGHFKGDIRSLIKGNIVETKHSRVAPLILNEKQFAEFKKKNPNHKYIKADTLGIMNDQELMRLQSTKSKISRILIFLIFHQYIFNKSQKSFQGLIVKE